MRKLTLLCLAITAIYLVSLAVTVYSYYDYWNRWSAELREEEGIFADFTDPWETTHPQQAWLFGIFGVILCGSWITVLSFNKLTAKEGTTK